MRGPSLGASGSGGSRTHLALAVVAVLVVAGFLLAMLTSTSGRFVPQVVDLYLVCQYAQAFAEGRPFQYNPGEAGSTGSTSLLYTAWLGLLHLVGLRGEGLVAGAIGTGAALYLASVALAIRIGRRLSDERTAALAGGLVALGGPVVWGFLYGSDIALFLCLTLFLFDRWLHAFDSGLFAGVALAGSLLALARPEGLPLAVLLAAAARFGPSPASARARALAGLPVLTGAGVLLLQRLFTGRWLGTSVADKSLLANYGLLDTLALASGFVTDVARGLLLGFYPSEAPIGFARGFASLFLPPLALAFVLLALATEPASRRFASRSFVAATLFVAFLSGTNMFMGAHFNRYFMWTLPALLVLTAVGLGRVAMLLSPGDAARQRAIFTSFAGLFLALGALSTLRMAGHYGALAGEMARRELPMAEWIRDHLPPGAPVANAATSLEYLAGYRATNLHGVTSPAFFGGRTAEREAALFEALSRLPAPERPTYLLTSASVQAKSELMRELVEGDPLHATFSLADELLLFRMRADLPGRQARPQLESTNAAAAGLEEVDRLNVGDPLDEARHGYTCESALGDLRLHGTVKLADYPATRGPGLRVADAGRAILGFERFKIRSRGGRDLLVAMRTSGRVDASVLRAGGSAVHTLDLAEARLQVRAGGATAGQVTLRTGPGWSEVLLRLPGSQVGEGSTEIEVRGRYASFHYWFYQ